MQSIFRFLLVAGLILPALPAGQAIEGGKKKFKQWLEEEVKWIISRSEEQEAKKLDTDQQRAAFVERFWEDRDPSPGTPKNEYKEEHYRRLAYASEEFKEGGPGWRSDRGRVFIIHGPPVARNRLQDREVWTYNRNPYAEYYKGAITLVFRQGATVFQSRLLSDTRAARSRNVPSGGVSPGAIVSRSGASGKFRLTDAAPPHFLSSAAATSDNLPTDLGETDRYIADILRSPGEVLEEARRDRERRHKAFADARADSAQVSFEGLTPEVTSYLFRTSQGARIYFGISLPSGQLEHLSAEQWEAAQDPEGKSKKNKEEAEAPRHAKVDLLCEISDQVSGYKVDSFDDTFVATEGEGLAVANFFNVPEGGVSLMCMLRDAASSKMGIRRVALEAQPLEGNRFDVSSPLLTQSLEQLEPGGRDPLDFQDVRFHVPTTLTVNPQMHGFLYFQVYNGQQASGQPRELVYEYVIQSGDQDVQASARRELPTDQAAEGTTRHALRLNLSSLDAGDYRLKLRIIEPSSNLMATRSTEFRIEPK